MLLFIPDSQDDVYPLLRLSISTPNSIWPIFFYNLCQNNLKIEQMHKRVHIHKRFSYE